MRDATRPAPRQGMRKEALIAASFVLIIVFIALAAPLISPYSPSTNLDIVNLRAQAPTLAHPFGTDLASRDLLSRVIYGARTSLSVALLAVLLSTTLGVAYGTIAGYLGGLVDTVLMRALDGLLSIPRVLLLIVMLSYWEKGATALIVGIGITGWFTIARLVRAEVIAAKPREYVSAAVALGARSHRIVIRHILPNVIGPAIVAATVAVAGVIALEAGLSFLGFGARTANASWGSIILDGQGAFQFWWIPLFPGLAVVATALAFNVLGDGLRDLIAGRREGVNP